MYATSGLGLNFICSQGGLKKKKTQLPTFKILKLNLKKIKNNRKRKKKDIKAGFLISLDDRRVREVCVTKA